jgi:ribonuclease P protein component
MNISKQHNFSSLKSRDEISKIMGKGKKLYLKTGLIFLFKEESVSDYKAAFLIKKKIGNAVKRNYVKRILRHILKNNLDQLKQFNRYVVLYHHRGIANYHMIENTILKKIKTL